MVNPLHEANRAMWDAAAAGYAARTDERGILSRAAAEPALVFDRRELAAMGDVAGRDVCVLGSGHNEAAFALAGLGGRVTSVDISQGQLDQAAVRARAAGLDIRFVRADVTDLAALPDASFDLVYTGGHVAVWVSDLWVYYAEAARVLRPGGMLLVNEYHPFRRIWSEDRSALRLAFDYFDRGPHEYDAEVAEEADGASAPLKQYEFHWTVSEFLAAVRDAGCDVLDVAEFGTEREAWERAELAGLPRCLVIVARKAGTGGPRA